MTEAGDLIVSEVFGPTFQGEGPSLGRRSGFVRLGRCNLACTWCDTPYTWDWQRYDPKTELRRIPAEEILGLLRQMDVPMVVITGGEPLLQQSHLPALLRPLRASGHRIEIETAGTLAPSGELVELVDGFNVSPKLASSGNPDHLRRKPEALAALAATEKAVFKFVAVEDGDLDEIGDVVAGSGLPPASVWVMPEGTDPDTVVRRGQALAERVLSEGWNLTTRLHVLVWGNRRGV